MPNGAANFTSGGDDSGDPGKNPFFGLVFDPTEPMSGPIEHDRRDLLGGFRADRRYIGWQTFFDFGDRQVKPNKRIDTTVSSVLFALPTSTIAGGQTDVQVLPQRNLLRHLTWSLPSGRKNTTIRVDPARCSARCPGGNSVGFSS